MGNYKSRASCSKDVPTYNYHEQVLEDAQEGFSGTTTTECVIGDEEYYSAEEGDSICSVTPERTRSESPSAGDSSGTSDEDDDDDDCSVESCSQDESCEESSYVSEEELLVTTETLTSSINLESDFISQEGSTFQGQDSFKLLPEKTGIISKSSVTSKDKTGLSHDISFRCRSNTTTSQEPREQTLSMENSSSFIPKQLLPDNADSDSNDCVISLKDDVSQSSESHNREFLLLTNVVPTTNGRKRKRIEYLKSSDSENDDVGNSRSQKSNKRRKMSTKRRNRSRQIRYSRNRRKSVSSERCEGNSKDGH